MILHQGKYYRTMPYCEGHITHPFPECRNCLTDFAKDDLIKLGMQDDRLRNKNCVNYREISLHILSPMVHTTATENS